MNFLQRLFWTPLLLLVFSPSSAQNWHPFPSGRIPIFKFVLAGDSVERFLASRIDSVRQEGGAEAHYFYRINRPLSPGEVIVGCAGGLIDYPDGYALNQDHYFGQKALLYPDGKCVFWSSAADSFVLLTNALPGQSWIFQGNVTATMLPIAMDSILGAADSVKVVALTDGREIRLSRSYGISRFPNLLPFNPYDGSLQDCDFQLVGEQTAGLGTTLPGFEEVFDFDSGDQVGIREYGGVGLGISWVETIVTTYLGRNLGYPWAYNTIYNLDRVDHQGSGQDIHTQELGQSSVSIFDTAAFAHLDLLPYEYKPGIAFMQYPDFVQMGIHRSAYHGRLMHTFLELSNWMSGVYDTCSNTIAGGTQPETFYVEGLGRVGKVVHTTFYPTVWDLRCYSKGPQTFGNCATLILGDTGSGTPDMRGMSVYPTVATDELNITWTFPGHRLPLTIEVLSTDGRRLLTSNPIEMEGTLHLDVAHWSAGVYLARVVSGGKQLQALRFLKLE